MEGRGRRCLLRAPGAALLGAAGGGGLAEGFGAGASPPARPGGAAAQPAEFVTRGPTGEGPTCAPCSKPAAPTELPRSPPAPGLPVRPCTRLLKMLFLNCTLFNVGPDWGREGTGGGAVTRLPSNGANQGRKLKRRS